MSTSLAINAGWGEGGGGGGGGGKEARPLHNSLHFLTYFSLSALSIECYVCMSDTTDPQNMNSCAKHPRKQDCGSLFDKCMAISATIQSPHGSASSFQVMQCAGQDLCNSEMCKTANSSGRVVSCSSSCCDKDLCNNEHLKLTNEVGVEMEKSQPSALPGLKVMSSMTDYLGRVCFWAYSEIGIALMIRIILPLRA